MIAGGYNRVRAVLRAPAEPYAALTGLRQSWGMFGRVNRQPALLQVEGRRGDDWVELYMARSGSARWEADLFDQERFRTFLNQFCWQRNRPAFRKLARWIAARAERDPTLSAVRVQMRPVELLPPETLRARGELPLGTPFWTVEHPVGERP